MMSGVSDEEMYAIADPARDQYFLTAPDKLSLLIEAAAIRPADHVVEVGAGIGTVAQGLPKCASLTLIELDGRFIDALRANVPGAQVIEGDGLSLLKRIRCDVLLSNLPTSLTDSLMELLSDLSVRTAVIAIRPDADFTRLEPKYTCEVVATINGDDFQPSQPGESILLKATRVG